MHRLGSLFDGATTTVTKGTDSRINEEVVVRARMGSKKKIAVIDVKGVIMAQASFDGASTKRISAELKVAREDNSVVAVILDMNTPGGEVTASDEIHRAVLKVREAGKPVVTCMHALGASGGYLVAAGTDYIVASRLTMTGSVGVILGTLNYNGLFEKIGLQSEIYKSGEMKDFLHGGRMRTEAEKVIMKQMIDANFREFAQIIADGRSRYATAGDVLAAQFADGRVLTGGQALEAGLVDELGYFENAVVKAKELAKAPDAKVVHYRRTIRFSDFFFSMQGAKVQGLSGLLPLEARVIKPGRMYYVMPSIMP